MGAQVRSTAPRAESGAVLCRCEGLRHAFGRHPVLRGCDLSVRAGEVVGLTGENGSGKSTLVRCLLGLLRAKAGSIERSTSIGYCPQENYLHRHYTVREHLTLVGALAHGNGPVDAQYLGRCLGVLRLEGYRDYSIGKLSGGTYQKLKFLTAILHRPRLLVLDEPTDGFDWSMYLAFWDLVRELVSRGSGVLMISHLLIDRERFDRIHELREGRVHDA